MKNNLELIFGNTLKEIRNTRELNITSMARQLGYSTRYVKELEEGEKLPTLSFVNTLNNALILTEEEKENINVAYFTLHPSIPIEVAYYIYKNNLISTLKNLEQVDKDGLKIKMLAYDLNKNSK